MLRGWSVSPGSREVGRGKQQRISAFQIFMRVIFALARFEVLPSESCEPGDTGCWFWVESGWVGLTLVQVGT